MISVICAIVGILSYDVKGKFAKSKSQKWRQMKLLSPTPYSLSKTNAQAVKLQSASLLHLL